MSYSPEPGPPRSVVCFKCHKNPCDCPSSFAAPAGYTARLAQLKALGDERDLAQVQKLLDDAGVPEWVENSDSDGVPSNSPVCRLKWYLSRRKNIEPWEADRKLQAEMAANLEAAKRYNAELSGQPPKNL